MPILACCDNDDVVGGNGACDVWFNDGGGGPCDDEDVGTGADCCCGLIVAENGELVFGTVVPIGMPGLEADGFELFDDDGDCICCNSELV